MDSGGDRKTEQESAAKRQHNSKAARHIHFVLFNLLNPNINRLSFPASSIGSDRGIRIDCVPFHRTLLSLENIQLKFLDEVPTLIRVQIKPVLVQKKVIVLGIEFPMKNVDVFRPGRNRLRTFSPRKSRGARGGAAPFSRQETSDRSERLVQLDDLTAACDIGCHGTWRAHVIDIP